MDLLAYIHHYQILYLDSVSGYLPLMINSTDLTRKTALMPIVRNYPGFEYSADQLYKFLAVLDFFTIMLQDGRIIHFTPEDENSFRQWLLLNKIKDMKTEKGWVAL